MRKNRLKITRWGVFGSIVLLALAAFEAFNFSTTEFAFSTFMQDRFLGFSWSVILAVAFCGIDFAGISRIFTDTTDMRKEPKEVWYLTAAWVVAGGVNAILTWWAVVVHIEGLSGVGNSVLNREQVLFWAPLLTAISVWLVRILIIGTIASAGDHLLNQGAPSGKQAVRRSSVNGSVSSPKPAKSPNKAYPRRESVRQRVEGIQQDGGTIDWADLLR